MNHTKAFNTHPVIKRMKKHINALEQRWNESTNPTTSHRLHNQIKGAQAAMDILVDEIKAQQPRAIPTPHPSNFSHIKHQFLSECG